MSTNVRFLLLGAVMATAIILIVPAVLTIVFGVLAIVGTLAIVRKLILPGAKISQIRGFSSELNRADRNSDD